MMGEPPAKRPRRTDSAAMWDRNETGNRNTTSPRSPRPHASNREGRSRNNDDSKDSGQTSKRNDDKRRRSRSLHDRDDRSRRIRSRSPRERGHRERERDRERVKEAGSRRDRNRSRSKDRHKPSRDHKNDRKRDRSRSPYRNGETTSNARQRSPPRARIKHEDHDTKELKDVKSAANGGPDEKMDVDATDGVDDVMTKMMGFSTFKSTQNTKVPGNQIYGVRKEKKTEYRQYMNRVGGFNRPLSPG